MRGRRRQGLGDRLAGERQLDRRQLAASVRPVLSPPPAPGSALALADSWPGVAVDRAWEVAGGQPIAWLGRRPVAAVVRRGKGLVMAMGFGSSWNDAALGNDWSAMPDGATLVRYDALFAMLRLLVEDKPIVPPDRRKAEALWRLRSQGASNSPQEPRARPLVRQK